MSRLTTEYNLVHAQNLVVNNPIALVFGEQEGSYSREQLLETMAVLQSYLGKTIEVAELLRLENNALQRRLGNE